MPCNVETTSLGSIVRLKESGGVWRILGVEGWLVRNTSSSMYNAVAQKRKKCLEKETFDFEHTSIGISESDFTPQIVEARSKVQWCEVQRGSRFADDLRALRFGERRAVAIHLKFLNLQLR